MKKTALIAGGIALAAAVIGFQNRFSSPGAPPESNRDALTRTLFEQRRIAFVYPDGSPDGTRYRESVEQLGQLNRFVRIDAVPVSSFDTLANTAPVAFVGQIKDLPPLQRMLDRLPFAATDKSFSINAFTYDGRTDVLRLVCPFPGETLRYLQVITGNDDDAILQYLQTRRRRFSGMDYLVRRENRLLAYGFLEESPTLPWRAVPEMEVNFARERRTILENEWFAVDYIGQNPDDPAIRNFVEEQQSYAERQLRQLMADPRERTRFFPVKLVLYETAERKTIATEDSRLSHWDTESDEIHIVFEDLVKGSDFSAIGSKIAARWAGGIANPRLLEASGLLFSENWGGEGYPVWAGRLYHNGFFVPFEELFSNDPRTGHSKYITAAQLATFLQFLLFHAGPRSLKQLLQETPAALSASQIKAFAPAHLIESWRTWCRAMLQDTRPPAPASLTTGNLGFEKGFCYAHEGYAVHNGYLGSTSRKAISRMREIGVNAISVTPFGYPRQIDKPAPLRRSDGPGSENDESLIISTAVARANGMQVSMKPHIWVGGRYWPGDIKMAKSEDWKKFFEGYLRWMAHYAILAQMQQMESLVVGVELVQATVGHEDAWRKMVRRLRTLYGGRMLYAANWGPEIENVTFWDAFDAIGVNCYYPLHPDAKATDAELRTGAKKVAEKLEAIAKKFDREIVLTEVGFASRPASWQEPHKDGRGAQPDEQAQRRAYEALFNAFYHQPWLKGMYLWKWPTYLENGGARHTGFTPNRKAAEAVVQSWYGR